MTEAAQAVAVPRDSGCVLTEHAISNIKQLGPR